MPKEPCGFKAALEGALELAGTDPLLRGTEQINRLKPYPHRHMARLEYGADLDRKGLAADVALAKTNPVGFSTQSADLFPRRAAVRAHRTVRPQPRFDIFVSDFFAMEMGGEKVGLHGLSP